jgi:regulator of sigma E protease
MLTALIFLLILLSAVIVHEFAHYLNARSIGLLVPIFSVGMGPVLLRRVWHNTEWRLSLFPIGGYVDLPGMAPEMDANGQLQHASNGMAQKSLPEKLWVLAGGVIANFALGVALISTVILIAPGYRQITSNVTPQEEGAVIANVSPGTPAQALGLLPEDRIIAINGNSNPSREAVTSEIQNSNLLDLLILRGEVTINASLPWPPAGTTGKPLLGVYLTPLTVEHQTVGVLQALGEALWFSVRLLPEMIHGFAKGFASTVTGRQTEVLVGPIGIVGLVNQATRLGIAPVLFLAAVINLSLAIFNLFPIPGLDGGRMLLATVVSLRGRPFRPGQEETIHFFGIVAVLTLIVLITLNEISGLVSS